MFHHIRLFDGLGSMCRMMQEISLLDIHLWEESFRTGMWTLQKLILQNHYLISCQSIRLWAYLGLFECPVDRESSYQSFFKFKNLVINLDCKNEYLFENDLFNLPWDSYYQSDFQCYCGAKELLRIGKISNTLAICVVGS